MGIKNIKEKINLLESKNIVVKTFRIKSQKEGLIYNFCDIKLYSKEMSEYIEEIKNHYINEEDAILKIKETEKYNGYNTYDKICNIMNSDKLVSDSLKKIEESIKSSNREGDATKYNSGIAIVSDEIKLFSVIKPYKVYKKRLFSLDGKKYKKVDGKFLVMPSEFDLIVLDNELYLFNNRAEKLFDFDRSYKNICKSKIANINTFKVIDDIKYFEEISLKGLNPKKYYRFDDKKVEKVCSNKQLIKKIAERLKINVSDDNSKFLIKDDEKAVEKLIKFFCGQVARDLLEEVAIEVPYTQPLE